MSPSPSISANEVIRALNLTPLGIEGGFCNELYHCSVRSEDLAHACGSSIYYLLRSTDRSCWHRLTADEIWYYHAGSPVGQLLITPKGTLEWAVIGGDVLAGQVPQRIVPAGSWQTAVTLDRTPGAWGLCGAAVFPGFEYSDFVGSDDEEIVKLYPSLRDEIRQFPEGHVSRIP